MTEEMNPDKPGSIQNWWDQAHSVAHPIWLTGSEGPETWRVLKVSKLIKPGARVLNIGVGMGTCTRGIAGLGAKVSALDISQVAIDRVQDVTEAGYLAGRIDQLPQNSFDLAISNLVSQHMMDEDLETQLYHVIRSLKAGGLMAMQFAFSWNQASVTMNNSPEAAKKGAICRTLGRIEAMVDQAEGMITWAQMIASWPEYGSGWYGVHIVKKADSTFSYADSYAGDGFSKWGPGNVDHFGALTLHVQGLEKDLAGVVKDREHLSLLVDRLKKESDEARRYAEEAGRQNERLQAEINGMLTSRSWRVTRPLREAMQFVRKRV